MDVQYNATTTYGEMMRDSIRAKYSFIRYYYTSLMRVSQEGGAFYKPLFFEFPNDPQAYTAEVSNNVMLGEALKFSALATTLDQNTTDFYFPKGYWCNIVTPTAPCFDHTNGGASVTLSSYASDYYVHLRDGYIVPYQDAFAAGASTTADMQSYPVELHINPTCDADSCVATGYVYNDDGVVLSTSGNAN